MQPTLTQSAVLTRPDGRNEELAARLRAADWQVHEWPALRIEPLPYESDNIPLPKDFDLAVFVSGSAVAHYLAQLQARGVAAWPPSCIAAAVGPATAARLRASGSLGKACEIVHPALDAPRHDSEALWDRLVARGPIPRRVLLIRGVAGRDWLAERLREHGADVHPHAVYRRSPTRWDDHMLAQLAQWAATESHPTWLLTSGESIDAARANVALVAPEFWWKACRFVVTHSRLVARLGLPQKLAARNVRTCVPADESIFNAFVSGCVIV